MIDNDENAQALGRWSRNARDRRDEMQRKRAGRVHKLQVCLRWAMIGALIALTLGVVWQTLRADDTAYRCRLEQIKPESCRR